MPATKKSITGSTSISELANIALESGLPIDRLLSQAALESYSAKRGPGKRSSRDSLEFLQADKRPDAALLFTKDPKVAWSLTTQLALTTLQSTNRAIELIDDLATGNDIPIFALLGLRNLSSFVGEIASETLNQLPEFVSTIRHLCHLHGAVHAPRPSFPWPASHLPPNCTHVGVLAVLSVRRVAVARKSNLD